MALGFAGPLPLFGLAALQTVEAPPTVGLLAPHPALGLAALVSVGAPTVGFLSPLGPLAGGTLQLVGFVSLLGFLGAGVSIEAPVEPPTGGGGTGFPGRLPYLRPERPEPERLPVLEPITSTAQGRVLWEATAAVTTSHPVPWESLVKQPERLVKVGRRKVRRRVAVPSEPARVLVVDDDTFGLELEDLELELR